MAPTLQTRTLQSNGIPTSLTQRMVTFPYVDKESSVLHNDDDDEDQIDINKIHPENANLDLNNNLASAPTKLIELEEEEDADHEVAIDDEFAKRHHSFEFRDIKWRNTFLLITVHAMALYGLWLYVTGRMKWQCAFVAHVFGVLSALGITAGAHRLWSHRAYKARWPLRLFLALCNACALEMDIYDWCRDHRVHHKHSETNADPHNSNRGFFFAHMGWLMLYKHPDVAKAGSKIDFSDVWADPIVRFQRRFYIPLVIAMWFALPTYICCRFFNESLWNAFLFVVLFRYVYILHWTWNVNSAAHIFGNRPYNMNIQPRENKLVSYYTLGEGYHNYHHTFPWDYSASELGYKYNFNFTTFFIDCCERVGLAYDLRKPSEETIKRRIQREHGTLAETDGSLEARGMLPAIVDWGIGLLTNASIFILLIGMRTIIAGL